MSPHARPGEDATAFFRPCACTAPIHVACCERCRTDSSFRNASTHCAECRTAYELAPNPRTRFAKFQMILTFLASFAVVAAIVLLLMAATKFVSDAVRPYRAPRATPDPSLKLIEDHIAEILTQTFLGFFVMQLAIARNLPSRCVRQDIFDAPLAAFHYRCVALLVTLISLAWCLPTLLLASALVATKCFILLWAHGVSQVACIAALYTRWVFRNHNTKVVGRKEEVSP